jgi:hypothetical protein
VLLDPNTWSEDGTVPLAIMKFSEDAEFLAYGQSASGSKWITIRVMHVADRVIQPDTLSWLQPSASVVMVDTWVPLLWFVQIAEFAVPCHGLRSCFPLVVKDGSLCHWLVLILHLCSDSSTRLLTDSNSLSQHGEAHG